MADPAGPADPDGPGRHDGPAGPGRRRLTPVVLGGAVLAAVAVVVVSVVLATGTSSSPAGTATGGGNGGGHAPASSTSASSTSAAPPTAARGPGGGRGAGSDPSPARVVVCGTVLCAGGTTFSLYGATIYNPGLRPYRSGIEDPSGTIALAEQAHLDTIRITDFLDVDGDPASAPYDPTAWGYVDAMIAAAGAAGLHVDLSLADYRATLWNRCIDPYTADWSRFVSFVANRVNTVTHLAYKDDPTIAFVSVAGEPLQVGTHTYTASATGAPCTLSYSTADLTAFYTSVLSDWHQQGGTVLINSGGLGYLNEPSAGIDWQSIFSLSDNAFCDIKTYGGMQAWAPTAAAYCHAIGKPILVEEFGWQQGEGTAGDAARAQLFDAMVAEIRGFGAAGLVFWNLGYQISPTGYDIGPSTPDAFAAVVQQAP